ncbi:MULTISPECIES: LPS export ABC transporter periplasmic protein LptC [Legionella]|uniref:LPS export ABC transporter periplasmic protein LptC n=1 Tax=Legionella resiliens TaxID=2905958 RepID=A0ABS8X8S0_9GAMM|nr:MULTISPECIES: LPS export ABC transporter periplasmic protein LptC [unclassified Legionella]MCE0724261.1 LPS export ABC transporter periplasmic protein LptC [Legionella sp. 9fVS26]MCE3533413.1 LPS export ABC transporter periplasmic protein LptC [Legionella sp. 8cVS16]QLZ69598.1 LPS export ABC transporter periplasmic protein LptC [Legionella sp. PC1000]
MNATKQFMWLFFTLILLACSGWYYSHSKTLIRLDSETLANSVDTTISNVIVRQFNQQGLLANQLTSPFMQHIQKDNVYLFQNPHIVVSQEEQAPWDISSIKAKSFEGGKQITFTGNVVVHQKKGNNSQESTLKTEEVTYYPKEKKASSDVLVTYEQPGNIIQSTGMNAYLDEKRVELLHQARGSYVPANG